MIKIKIMGSTIKSLFTYVNEFYTYRFNFISLDLSMFGQNFNLHDILCLRKLGSKKIKLNITV